MVDLYAFPGFRPKAGVIGVFGDPNARLVWLQRRGKKRAAGAVADARDGFTNERSDGCEIFQRGQQGSTSRWKSGVSFAATARR